MAPTQVIILVHDQSENNDQLMSPKNLGRYEVRGDTTRYFACVKTLPIMNRAALHHQYHPVYIAADGIISSHDGFEYAYDENRSVQYVLAMMCALRYYNRFARWHYNRSIVIKHDDMPSWRTNDETVATVDICHNDHGVRIIGLQPTRAANGSFDMRFF